MDPVPSSTVYILARRVHAQRTALTNAHAHRAALYTGSPVLYNAAIDSRPLFHARDLLQSLQPVSGDSVQCPVSLPVSVHKIYFPMRYTGWRRENWTRFLDPAENPIPYEPVSTILILLVCLNQRATIRVLLKKLLIDIIRLLCSPCYSINKVRHD